jgi:hypothetical protein
MGEGVGSRGEVGGGLWGDYPGQGRGGLPGRRAGGGAANLYIVHMLVVEGASIIGCMCWGQFVPAIFCWVPAVLPLPIRHSLQQIVIVSCQSDCFLKCFLQMQTCSYFLHGSHLPIVFQCPFFTVPNFVNVYSRNLSFFSDRSRNLSIWNSAVKTSRKY